MTHPRAPLTCHRCYPRWLLPIGLSLLASCSGPVSQADCDYLQTTANETLNQVMAVYADSSNTYNAENERLVALLYSDGSQALYEPDITHPKLKPIQDELVEVFQKAADQRYEASELIPADVNSLPTPDAEQQIIALQLESEAEIPAKLQALAAVCDR